MVALINERGNRYGTRTVQDADPKKGRRTKWLCKCDCGREDWVAGCDLRGGRAKSCHSCGRMEDLRGARFGDRFVLDASPLRINEQTKWLCECKCGKMEWVLASALKRGIADRCRSCGRLKYNKEKKSGSVKLTSIKGWGLV